MADNPINNESVRVALPPAVISKASQRGVIPKHANQGGTTDGFVAQISNDGSTIIRSLHMGTGAFDAVYGIKFDKLGIPYIMGVTEGTWPIQNAAYNGGNSRQFIAKLDPDLSGFIYSTASGNLRRTPNISLACLPG